MGSGPEAGIGSTPRRVEGEDGRWGGAARRMPLRCVRRGVGRAPAGAALSSGPWLDASDARRPGLAPRALEPPEGALRLRGPARRTSEQSALGRRARALVVEEALQAADLLLVEIGGVDREVRPDRHATLYGGPGGELLEPPLEVGKLVEVLALRLPADGPGVGDHVRDRVLVASEIAAIVEAIVHDPVETVHLVAEATQGIGLVSLADAESSEMPGLTALGALIRHLPDHPLLDLVLPAQVLGMEAVGLLGEVEHDGRPLPSPGPAREA